MKGQARRTRSGDLEKEAESQREPEPDSSDSDSDTDNESEQGEEISAEIQKRVAIETKRYIDSLKKKGKLEKEMRASSATATSDDNRNSNKVQELLNEKKLNEDSLRNLEVELAKAGYMSE